MALVCKTEAIPNDIQHLAKQATGEGFRFLQRLVDEYASGVNAFTLPGEALFEIRVENVLVAVGGLNIDQKSQDRSVGRIRRVYVHPDYRGMGIGRALIEAIENQACGTFRHIRLFTDTENAQRFYAALGYTTLDADNQATHTKSL